METIKEENLTSFTDSVDVADINKTDCQLGGDPYTHIIAEYPSKYIYMVKIIFQTLKGSIAITHVHLASYWSSIKMIICHSINH